MASRRLYVKDESRNPTWSFKDRMAAVAATKARELGCEVLTIGSDRQRRRGHRGAMPPGRPPRGHPDDAERAGGHAALHAGLWGPVVAVPTLADRWTLVREGVETPRLVPGAELRDAAGRREPILRSTAPRPSDSSCASSSAGGLPTPSWPRCPTATSRSATWRRIPGVPGARAHRPRARMMAAEVFGSVANALGPRPRPPRADAWRPLGRRRRRRRRTAPTRACGWCATLAASP